MCEYHDISGAQSRQRFPVNGLVAQSRIAYQTAPLLRDEVRPGLFVFAGAGGAVTAVAGAEAVAVVDTGYGPRVAEIRRAMAAALPREPKWLIDAHWRFDHTDGNAPFAAAGSIIVAHSNCRERLSHTQYVPSLDREIPASPPGAWPIATCDGPVSIDLGAQPVRLLPQRPSHTDGDLVVHLPSANVLVMGDLLTTAGYPVIDESSGGTLRGMIEAIESLLPLVDDDTVVVPGHGAMADRDGVLGFLDMLRTIEGRVLHLIAANLTAPEIIGGAPTAEFDARWGSGYVTGPHFTRMVLAGLGMTEMPGRFAFQT
jgi:glyoxylase-like metal-dependent hydrolase (beta-lactamase superfamily II)